MPDGVLYFGKKDWLLLVESATSHGRVDARRHNELGGLFKDVKSGLGYVTAFPDRGIMRRYLEEISWANGSVVRQRAHEPHPFQRRSPSWPL